MSSRKCSKLLIGLSVLLASAPVGAADTDLPRAYAAGYRAQLTCSALWNGDGKSLSDIERDELTGIYPEIQAEIGALKADIDAENHIVRVAYRDDMPPRIAQWNSREGCVGLPIGATATQASGSETPARANFDSQRWPLGDQDAKATKSAAVSKLTAVGTDIQKYGGRSSAALIVKNGKIAWEWYQPGHDVHTAQRTWSVAKSMAGTLIGHTVQLGQIDVTAPANIAEWQSAGDPRAAITTDQLMRMASGLTSDSAGNRTDAIYMGGASVRPQVTQWSLLHPPGSHFRYANNDILLATLSAKAAQHDPAFNPAAFFDKVGMTRTFAEHDKDGDYILSSQVWTTARDMARMGLLYLNDGMVGKERLLPADWGAFVSRPSGPQPAEGFGYGATFWLMDKSEGIPKDSFAALGNRGQFLVIIPSRSLLIVRRGYDSATNRFDIEAFTRAVVAADQSKAG
jgi:CubicO group peptidase (beta-lactamase class C family)